MGFARRTHDRRPRLREVLVRFQSGIGGMIMKKKMMLPLAVMVLLLSAGCGKTDEGSTQVPTAVKLSEDEAGEGQSGEGPSVDFASVDPSGGEAPGENPQEGGRQPEGLETARPGSGLDGAETGFRFEDLSDRVFYFSSGAGAWFTELRIRSDGSFEGLYQDADMGVTGDGYPNGTLYYCEFSGTFDQLEKVDGFTYKMNLSTISFEHEPEIEEIVDGVRYIYSGAYGLDGEEFYLYLPGSKLADLPQAFREWVGYYDLEAVQEEELSFYGLYNADGELGFSSSVYVEQSLSERIAMEISYAEEREKEVEKMQKEAVTQTEMNESAAELYRLWDDTLNVVWRLLEADLDTADMEALREEEMEWIASKDAEVQAAGQEHEGGSAQPLDEAMKAAELTKARVYELAKYAEGR